MKAPTGATIIGTEDLIPGVARGTFKDGAFDFHDETVVDWNGQETIKIAGETVYRDEQGIAWLESQLIAEDAETLPDDQINPWHADPRLVAVEIGNQLDNLFEICGGELQPDGRAYLVATIVGELNLTRPK